MKSYVLCRNHFTDSFVEQIKAEIPGWHCIEKRFDANVYRQPPNVLCIIAGSATQQKEQRVKVRFCGGSSIGSLTVGVKELGELLGASQEECAPSTCVNKVTATC